MTLCKLAFRNIKRSARDYAIYFVTLLLGVAVFYAFNSIGSQQLVEEMNAAGGSLVQLVDEMMGLFSVVVAFVLGFLILYANRFLIKRRKKEFGTYLLLGMKPSQVSAIVLMETLFVGAFSFTAGILLGILLSQGLSFVTAVLFGTVMNEYRFVFSPSALAFTAVCFALIYLVVALFNTVQVRRCRLATLLSASASNEKVVVRNIPASIVAFIVSIVLIACSYVQLAENGLVEFDNRFFLATALMLIGTLLLFWSVAGFSIALIQRTRGVYFRGLTMFTMRQIASKVNTAFVSLWAVSILLFFGITVFASGIGMGQMFAQNIEDNTRYDATLSCDMFNLSYVDKRLLDENEVADAEKDRKKNLPKLMKKYQSCNGDMAQYLSDRSSIWPSVVEKSFQIDIWTDPDIAYRKVADESGYSLEGSSISNSSQALARGIELIPLSQFNQALAFNGLDSIRLSEGEYAINNTLDLTADLAQRICDSGYTLKVGDRSLSPTGTIVRLEIEDNMMSLSAAQLVVPDSVIDQYRKRGVEIPARSVLNVRYRPGASRPDDLLSKAIAQVQPPDADSAAVGWSYQPEWPVMREITKSELVDQAKSVRMLATYLAIYIGFVLLVATAAMLAIQQLSEASDSQQRYRTLSQLGCDRKMIFGSLRTQVLVYFLAPLAVAICHSACAVSVLCHSLLDAWGISVGGAVAASAVLVVAVYGGYLLVTWATARSVVGSSLGKGLSGPK